MMFLWCMFCFMSGWCS